MDRIDNVITRNPDKTPNETVKAAWVHVKTAAEKQAAYDAEVAEAGASTIDVADVRTSFSRPDSVTDAAAGAYAFEQLPSFVYLGGSFTAATEGDENTPGTPAANDLYVLQPNDTDLTGALEANEVALDKLYLASYRITLAEVAPDFSLTTPHVGVNVGDKTLGDMAAITVPGLEGSDSDALRPDPAGDRVIQIVDEYFDNSWNGEGTFDEYDKNTEDNYNKDDRDEADENKNR